jgi:LPS sulfotransferase NodH
MMLKKFINSLLWGKNSSSCASRLAMFHIGRCGSTVVAKLLEQHRNIYWANELYEPIFKQWNRLNPDFTQPGIMPMHPIKYLKKSISKSSSETYGFEIKPYHFRLVGMTLEDYLKEIESIGFHKFIVLDRKNKLRKIISSIKAKQSGVYHLKIGSNPKIEKINIPVHEIQIDHECKSLLEFIDDYIKDIKLVDHILQNKNCLKLTYENDIESDPLIAYSKICSFIGVDEINPKISLTKTTPFPIRDLVENYDEVSKCLANSPYEWMLEN